MSSKKRAADNYLTDRNWDREKEDEEEEAPEPFKPASVDVLCKRTIKKAARRVKPGKDSASNPFSGFGGFGAKPPAFPAKNKPAFDIKPSGAVGFGASFKPLQSTNVQTTNASPFSFSFGKKPVAEPPKAGVADAINTSVNTSIDTSVNVNEATANASGVAKDTGRGIETTIATDSPNEEEKSLTKLASLNKCIVTWIEKHMEDDDCIDLSPVFSDYEKHLKEISV